MEKKQFEKFKEPIKRYVSNLESEVTFLGICKEKDMIWGQTKTEEGIIDLLIPSSIIILKK